MKAMTSSVPFLVLGLIFPDTHLINCLEYFSHFPHIVLLLSGWLVTAPQTTKKPYQRALNNLLVVWGAVRYIVTCNALLICA